MIPYAILNGRSSVRGWATVEPSTASELLATAALTLALVPAFLYIGMKIEAAIPLSVLIGLLSMQLFRLIFSPGRTDLFFPVTMVVGYFAVYVAIRSLYLYTVPFLTRVGKNAYDDYIPAALWCACLAYFAFLMGMKSGIARRCVRRMPTPSHWPPFLPALQIALLMSIGLVSLLYLFKIGMTVGNFGNREFQSNPPPGTPILLENLIDLSWIAICMHLVSPAKPLHRGLAWLLLGISFGILCVKLAITGGKVALIQPFMESAIVFHYLRRRLRIWEILAFGVPVLMLAFGAVNFYRFVVVGHHGSSKSLSDVISRVSTASELLTASGSTGSRRPAFEQMVERNAGIDAVALIMKYTPHPFPYVYGRHWLEIPLTFVPRQIWKDKPINMPSAEFESTYMGMPGNYNGFSSMQLMGDFYRNFSLVGVACGMFFLGVLLRFFYLYCSPSSLNGTGVFLYAALFPEIIHSLETDAGYAIINVSRAAALAICVALFLGARFRKLHRVKVARRTLASLNGGGAFAIPPDGPV